MKDKLRNLLLPVLTAALAAGVVIIVMNRNSSEDTRQSETSSNTNPLTVGYATEGVTAVGNQDEFNEAVDEMIAKSKEQGVTVEYQYDAFSKDGQNFSCYLGNAASNGTDMFIAIYADSTFEDELFLSELLRPGTAFDHITLNYALKPGIHDAVVAFTLVAEEDGQQVITKQTFAGLSLHVG